MPRHRPPRCSRRGARLRIRRASAHRGCPRRRPQHGRAPPNGPPRKRAQGCLRQRRISRSCKRQDQRRLAPYLLPPRRLLRGRQMRRPAPLPDPRRRSALPLSRGLPRRPPRPPPSGPSMLTPSAGCHPVYRRQWRAQPNHHHPSVPPWVGQCPPLAVGKGQVHRASWRPPSRKLRRPRPPHRRWQWTDLQEADQ